MSAAAAHLAPRFVRRTTLAENEYRVNFKQIDNDVIKALISPEAREVTPMMSTIYLSLLASPPACWEREGVLHFVGEDRVDERLTAWEQMREIAGVANSTLSKALDWMSKLGVIGYDARANGVGIRVFFNRASSSIRPGIRPGIGPSQARQEQKILRLVPTPSGAAPTPTNGAPFKENYSENNRENSSPRAFAREESALDKEQPVIAEPGDNRASSPSNLQMTADQTSNSTGVDATLVRTLTRRIASELRPEIAEAVKRETDGAREWFLKYGLPKATRVAQRETYDLLRSQGLIAKKSDSGNVGRYDKVEGQGREGKSEVERIAAFLAETGEALERAAMEADTSGRTELRAACHTAGAELDRLRDRIVSGLQLSLDEIGGTLTAIEERLTDTVWRATDPDERDAMLKTAREEMRGYAARMDREVFDDTARQRVRARLREMRGIPRIDMFFI
ncbi:MAG: hypothetical protein ACREBD_09715 [Blastocatellia bacterium]